MAPYVIFNEFDFLLGVLLEPFNRSSQFSMIQLVLHSPVLFDEAENIDKATFISFTDKSKDVQNTRKRPFTFHAKCNLNSSL